MVADDERRREGAEGSAVTVVSCLSVSVGPRGSLVRLPFLCSVTQSGGGTWGKPPAWPRVEQELGYFLRAAL